MLDELIRDLTKVQPMSKSEAKKRIQALVRTEKLKLLAEVRERVVGEDNLLFGHGEDWEGAEPQNRLKQDQRTELTKLEAEL